MSKILTGQFSMKRFMELVKSNNWHFNLGASSLAPLIDCVGGAQNTARGEDWRDLNRAQLQKLMAIIWPVGEGNLDTPWGKKKQKYKKALGYLAGTLYDIAENDAVLVGSYKTNWQARTLTADMQFVSAKSIPASKLHNSGCLSRRFASELCIGSGDNDMIGDWELGHKFLFGTPMQTKPGGKLKTNGLKNQGFGEYIYCFERKAGTRYMCTHDVVTSSNYSGEVAFVDDVTLKYIKPYENGVAKDIALWEASEWTRSGQT